VLLLLFGADGSINRLEGLLMFGGILAYTGWCIRQSRKETSGIQAEFAGDWRAAQPGARPVLCCGLLIAAGLALLSLGSRWLVDGAVSVAESLGVSQLVIGLTIVAAGTSLPEVVTSIVAAIRGERDIAVGNVVGSNLFNILCVLGLASAIAPGGVTVSPSALWFDVPVMIAVAVACLPIFFTGHVIARWEGGLFFFYYLAYTAYLVLDATGSEFSRTLAGVMIGFVAPLTAVTLGVTTLRSLRQRRALK
jgi:cation:H+ antiporter